MRKTILTLSLLAVAVLIFCFSSYSLVKRKAAHPLLEGPRNSEFKNAEETLKQTREILLSRFQGRALNSESLYLAATQGMFDSLNDGTHDWNKLLTPAELKEIEKDDRSEFAGIGFEISFNPESGLTRVFGITPGGPAEKNDVRVEDQIISVNGKTYKGKTISDVVHDLRGNLGDEVKLKLLRGDEVVSKEITLELITWQPVEWSILSNKIGLLTLGSFGKTTPQLIAKAIHDFNQAAILALVIDLRDNYGGIFENAILSSELFLPQYAVIGQILTRNHTEEKKVASRPSLLANVPIAIISNLNTAAGAELFASALIENLGATLLGQKTAGKWNVQTLEKLPNGFGIRYTHQTFRSARGTSYQDTGLTPDIEVNSKSDISYRQARSSKILLDRLKGDPQLRAALVFLKAGLKQGPLLLKSDPVVPEKEQRR